MKNGVTKALSCVVLAAALAVPGAVEAKDAGDFLVRLRGVAVSPDESGGTDALGGDINVSTTLAPEIDFSYFITKNIGLELVATTTRHSLGLSNSAAPGTLDLGDVWVLPPTLMLQYHFFSDELISPYIGAGLNYSFFYGETDGPDVNSVDVENTWGYGFGAGFDIQFDSGFVFNVDVKRMFISPNVKVNDGAIESQHFDLDPWIIGTGFGYRF
jgi:outer membrane protein